jgi:hypothetical protein
LLETAVSQDLPRQLDKIEYPKPLQIGFGFDVVDHHLADGFKILPVFAG